jgi:phosphotransferase system enzyme I (PtsI)
MKPLNGVAASGGIAIGRAHVLSALSVEVSHHFISSDQLEVELARFDAAVELARTELIELRQNLSQDAPAELSAFIEVHELMLHDPIMTRSPRDLIEKRRYNAAWALSTQVEQLAKQFEEMDDAYLRERSFDVRQVGERILKHLARDPSAVQPQTAPGAGDEIVIVAHDIAPADMLEFKEVHFAGFVTDLGGATSHTAIVARSLQLPAVVACNNATHYIKQDDFLIVDGYTGKVYVNPDESIRAQFAVLVELERGKRAALLQIRDLPAVTPAGVRIELAANIELPDDVDDALAANVDAIGLFRTEFLFMGRKVLPDEDEQFSAYARVVLAMAGKPVTIRTLDIGADKTLDANYDPYAAVAPNPALGLRAIRFCLANPDMFRTQLRAILRASALGKVKILIPMIAHEHEIDQTLGQIERAKKELKARGEKFDAQVPIGAMIEIPAAALAINTLLPKLDFASLGTNDLIQYTLAIDRADAQVAYLYQPSHPAVMQLIEHTIKSCNLAGKPVSVCGEMAGDPLFTERLLQMGLRSFSMHPGCILPVKSIVRSSLSDPMVQPSAVAMAAVVAV